MHFRILGRVLFLAALFCAVACVAQAAVDAAALRGFNKGATTQEQVIAKLGKPDKTEATDEGLTTIGYLPSGGDAQRFSPTAVFGGVSSLAAGNTGSTYAPGTAALQFDRAGKLVNYVGFVGDAAAPRRITSEDNVAALPQVTVELSDADRAGLKVVNDGKPHLGLQVSPTDGQPDEKTRFAAAKFSGMIVAAVLPGGPADRAGIKAGDYIYMLNGYLVTSDKDVTRAMTGVKLGDQVRARARRIDRTTRNISEQVFTLKF